MKKAVTPPVNAQSNTTPALRTRFFKSRYALFTNNAAAKKRSNTVKIICSSFAPILPYSAETYNIVRSATLQNRLFPSQITIRRKSHPASIEKRSPTGTASMTPIIQPSHGLLTRDDKTFPIKTPRNKRDAAWNHLLLPANPLRIFLT